MSTKAVVTSLFLATGLALAGCAGEPRAQENTPAAQTSPSPSDTVRGTTPEPTSEKTPEPSSEAAPDPAENPQPQPEAAPPAAEEPVRADPWTAFSATPEGQRLAGTVAGITAIPMSIAVTE